MRACNVVSPKFSGINPGLVVKPEVKQEVKADAEKKPTFLDKFETGVRNSADLNDTIKVPRTIFKGYMAFMASTTMLTLASFAKNKFKGVSTGMNIAASLTALWGTYSFVRPYLIKDPK